MIDASSTAPSLRSPGLAPPGAQAWRVCVGSGIVAALSGTMLWYSTLGVFMGSLEKEFGWSRAEIAFGVTLMTLTTPLLAPMAGWVIDRVNLRRLILVSIGCQAVVLQAAALLGNTIAGFYALCLAMAAVAYGASVLPLSKIVIGWFDASRGKALGVLFAFASLGPVLYPMITQTLIVSVGWRLTYACLGVALLLLGLSTAFVWIRERSPLVAVSPTQGLASQVSPSQVSMSELLGTRAWWSLAGWNACYAFGAGALNLHLYSLMLERAATPSQAAGAASLLGLGLLLGNLTAGHLLDRMPARRLASGLMLAPIVAVLMLLLLPGVTVGLAASFVLGLAAGGESSALTFLVGRYFAPNIYGRAYASQTVPLALAAGLGPWVGGLLHGQSGYYDSTLVLSALMFALAAMAPLALPKSV